MDQELKRKWIEALRSGKYQQTQGLLNRTRPSDDKPAGMCCLGVLCDIVDPKGWIVVDENTKAFRNPLNTGYLPDDDLGEMIGSYQHRLAARNDDGASFAEIADYVEAYL